MREELPKYVKTDMSEGRSGVFERILETVRNVAKEEPLLMCAGDTIHAEYSNDPQASNSKKTVDAALDRLITALEAEHFTLQHINSGFNDAGAGDTWRVIQKKET